MDEDAESARRFQELSRVQALSGLKFLSWRERVPVELARAIALTIALVISLTFALAFYMALANRRQRALVQLETQLKSNHMAGRSQASL